jgi:hypothetical protein
VWGRLSFCPSIQHEGERVYFPATPHSIRVRASIYRAIHIPWGLGRAFCYPSIQHKGVGVSFLLNHTAWGWVGLSSSATTQHKGAGVYLYSHPHTMRVRESILLPIYTESGWMRLTSCSVTQQEGERVNHSNHPHTPFHRKDSQISLIRGYLSKFDAVHRYPVTPIGLKNLSVPMPPLTIRGHTPISRHTNRSKKFQLPAGASENSGQYGISGQTNRAQKSQFTAGISLNSGQYADIPPHQ